MSAERSQIAPEAESVEEVGRIRDIIFGQQMRDYQQRFDALRRDLERLQGELDRLRQQLTDQDGDQSKRLGALRQETRDADEALRSELRETAARLTDEKTDRSVLADLLIQLGANLKGGASIDGMLRSLTASTKD
jgi:hypothetical protein